MFKSFFAKSVLNVIVPIVAPVFVKTAEAWRAWALDELARRVAKLPQPPQPPQS